MNKKKYHDFEVIKEGWNKYRLNDGALLKIKFVIKKIFEVEEPKDNSQITFDYQEIVALGEVPEDIRGASNETPIDRNELKNHIIAKFLDFETVVEEWNEYQFITDKRKIRIKYSLTVIHKTDLFDIHGEPVYIIEKNLQFLVIPSSS